MAGPTGYCRELGLLGWVVGVGKVDTVVAFIEVRGADSFLRHVDVSQVIVSDFGREV